MNLPTTWRCPVCKERLELDTSAAAWSCGNRHGFDVAREGYVNLLITHQRRRREPGDSAAMVRDRRAFLDGGWYQPLRDALQRFAGRGPALDAGCGEGYYTRGWPDLWAVDISKAAVRLAARRREGEEHYAVASAYDLPLPDASIATVVSVFAPLHSPELERVVHDGGLVVIVTPGPRHLEGLASLLFETFEPHPADGPLERPGAETSLRPLDRARITYDLVVDDAAMIGALLGMTPYSWYVDEATRERVRATPLLSTPVDFLVSVYQH